MNANINTINKQKLETIKSLDTETLGKILIKLYNDSIDSIFNNDTEKYKEEIQAYNEILGNADSVALENLNNQWLYYQMKEKNQSKARELALKLAIEEDRNTLLIFNYALQILVNFSFKFNYGIHYLNLEVTERNKLLDKQIDLANTYIELIESHEKYLYNAKNILPESYKLYNKVLNEFNRIVSIFNENRNKSNTELELAILEVET